MTQRAILVGFLCCLLSLVSCAGGGTSGTSNTHSRTLFAFIGLAPSESDTSSSIAVATESGPVGDVPLGTPGRVQFETEAGDVTLSLQTQSSEHSVILDNLEAQGSIVLLAGDVEIDSAEFTGESFEFALRVEEACSDFFFENTNLFLNSEGLPESCTFEVLVKRQGQAFRGSAVNVFQGACELPQAYEGESLVSTIETGNGGIGSISLPLAPLLEGSCYSFQGLVAESGRMDLLLQVVP